MRDHDVEPLFEQLLELKSITPRERVDSRIRRRCAALLAERRAQLEPPRRSARSADLMMAATVVVYLLAIASEAVRLLGAGRG
jgi:hypothetical protein